MIDDPVNDDQQSEDDSKFACACGDLQCVGDNEDAANIRIGAAWYAADCVMAANHPDVVYFRELDARLDRERDK